MARTVACAATARREKLRGENKEEVDISALALHRAVEIHSFAFRTRSMGCRREKGKSCKSVSFSTTLGTFLASSFGNSVGAK